MLRVSTGHYRDVFMRTVYDVSRTCTFYVGRVKMDCGKGWRFQLRGGQWSQVYASKELAAQAARREISDILFEIAQRGETPDPRG